MEAFEREGRPGTVPDEPFQAAAVVALNVHRGVDAEPAGSLPGEHTNGVVFLEQAPGAEVAQNAALHEALEGEGVVGGEPGGLVEAYGSVVSLFEDAVENDQVEVEVRVERRAEAVQEADAAQLCVGGSAGARAPERGADPRTAPATSGLWWR